jgi:hypothetical protein
LEGFAKEDSITYFIKQGGFKDDRIKHE